MKLTDDKLNKLIELVTKQLRKKLKREPTEEEVVEKLPLFLCKDDQPNYSHNSTINLAQKIGFPTKFEL